MIGIDSNTWLVYGGVSNYGDGVWPTPVMSIATLIAGEADWETPPSSPHLDNAKLIFRENSFDPVTRAVRASGLGRATRRPGDRVRAPAPPASHASRRNRRRAGAGRRPVRPLS